MIDESLGLLEQVDFDQGETNYAFSKQSRAMLIAKLSRLGGDSKRLFEIITI
jgi:hypothetical protein